MQLKVLSGMSHRLEDFFKILRLRYTSLQVNQGVETLMLRGLDSLRQIANYYRQELEPENDWLTEQVEPIFESLRQHLGEVQDADEDALLAQDEDVNPALMMFEEGVNVVLDRFEELLPTLDPTALAQELAATAEELVSFGEMANLENFIELCEAIGQQVKVVTEEKVESLAKGSLATWRRSHALVFRGRLDKLPSDLDSKPESEVDAEPDQTEETADFTGHFFRRNVSDSTRRIQ